MGTVLMAERFPEARRPAYKLTIDFGPELGVRKSSVQATVNYTPEQIEGRQVLGVVNFPEKQIGPFMSQVLTLGADDAKGNLVLLNVDTPVPNGARMF